MTAQSKIEPATLASGLDLLRTPFPEHQISKLPKETKAQIDARKADKNMMVFNCQVCGGHHHKNAVHLDYVGHAALTDRLLDVDPTWSWEPLSTDERGLPAFDQNRGLWIKLTVCGVTRLGYGSADGKQGGDAVKEIIGDALRNAAMRFGAALDLWHKGDLHLEDEDQGTGGDNAGARQMSSAGSNPTAAENEQQAAITKIISLCEAVGGNQSQAICEHYKISSFRELTKAQAEAVTKRLEEKLAEKAGSATDFGKELGDAIKY